MPTTGSTLFTFFKAAYFAFKPAWGNIGKIDRIFLQFLKANVLVYPLLPLILIAAFYSVRIVIFKHRLHPISGRPFVQIYLVIVMPFYRGIVGVLRAT